MSDGGPEKSNLGRDQERQCVQYLQNTYTISFPHLTRKMIWPAERKEHPWLLAVAWLSEGWILIL